MINQNKKEWAEGMGSCLSGDYEATAIDGGMLMGGVTLGECEDEAASSSSSGIGSSRYISSPSSSSS